MPQVGEAGKRILASGGGWLSRLYWQGG